MTLRTLLLWGTIVVLTMDMACELPSEITEEVEISEGVIEGDVVEFIGSGQPTPPIEDATIFLVTSLGSKTTRTDALGRYFFRINFQEFTDTNGVSPFPRIFNEDPAPGSDPIRVEVTTSKSDSKKDSTVQPIAPVILHGDPTPHNEPITANIFVSKPGFSPDSSSFVIAPGSRVTLPDFVLVDTAGVSAVPGPVGPPPGAPGPASSFVLIGVNPTEISVKGVGGVETATIVFEARDNQGRPIDTQQAITVNFVILSGPGGGEFITPTSIGTDAGGRVLSSINSGTRSGPMMIQAQATVGGTDVRSTPVQIAIASGLPDQAHFSVATQRLNFWGWDRINNRMDAVVIVGDVFSNPVKRATVVSFETDGNVVAGDNLADATGGSSLTDGAGVAVATIVSGNPRSVDPVFGAGYGYLKAQTIGLDTVTNTAVTVRDSTLYVTTSDIAVLLVDSSGVPIPPGGFSIPRGGSGVFRIVVQDVNGNSIFGGSTISMSSTYVPPEGSDIKIVIQPSSIDVPDALFPGTGTTIFTFVIADATTGGTTPAQQFPATVSVNHAGSGRVTKVTISGTVGG